MIENYFPYMIWGGLAMLVIILVIVIVEHWR
jgi:hypothetical protein